MTKRQFSNAESSAQVKNKTIFLDTNVIVGGYQHPAEFQEVLQDLADIGCDFTTIEAVRLEFFSKNRSPEELKKKVEFYGSIMTYPELPTSTFEKNLREISLLYAFGVQSKTFQAVDFMLAAVLKKYSNNALLLTNDHSGFTPSMFDLEEVIPLIPSSGGIVPFGLYSFSEDKYATMLNV